MKEFFDKGLELAQTHHDKSMMLIQLNDSLGDLAQARGTLESGISMAVATEMEGGKPKYSNETLRKAETSARLAANKGAKDLDDAQQALSLEKRQFEVEISHLEKQIRLYTAYLGGTR